MQRKAQHCIPMDFKGFVSTQTPQKERGFFTKSFGSQKEDEKRKPKQSKIFARSSVKEPKENVFKALLSYKRRFFPPIRVKPFMSFFLNAKRPKPLPSLQELFA